MKALGAVGGFFLVALLVCGLILGVVLSVTMTNSDEAAASQSLCESDAGSGEIPEKYKSMVAKASKASGLPASILAAQIDQESGWNETAKSNKGAQGLTQFMPATWKEYGNGGDPLNPEDAIAAQGRFMKFLVTYVKPVAASDEDVTKLALAAYNAGPGAVKKYNGIPPYPETQEYVEKITRKAQTKYETDCNTADENEVLGKLNGKWVEPLPKAKLTSGYGYRGCIPGLPCIEDIRIHKGMDLSTGSHGTVVAPTDMKVTFAGTSKDWKSAYGTYIIARQVEAPGYVFEFHHFVNGSLKVKAGDTVAAGTALGTEGATGNAKGTHLHFQINTPDSPDGRPFSKNAIDPMPILIKSGIW